MTTTASFVWVPCSAPGCPVDLRVIAAHYPTGSPTWHCLEHRHDSEEEQ